MKRMLFATLDYSQCFDRMSTATSLELCGQLGAPEALTATVEQVWRHTRDAR